MSAERDPGTLMRAPAASGHSGVDARRDPQAGQAWAVLLSDPARRAALADCWRVLWTSRALVWLAGVAAFGALGRARTSALDLPGLTRGLGLWGDRLAAPAAHWDAAWLLAIARDGYGATGSATAAARAAFFPSYPLLVRGVNELGVPLVAGGVLVSLGAFAAALYGLHRLTVLELSQRPGSSTVPAPQWPGASTASASPAPIGGSPESAAGSSMAAARAAVQLAAFFPAALFFSAVYSESLYLALSIGVFWSARRGRWATAGVLGALAAVTRNTGVLLLIPVAMLYCYGPRTDRAPDRIGARWRPRYRLRRDALWLSLVPAGLVAYGGYWLVRGGSVLLPVHAQGAWHRHLAPLAGVWRGLVAGVDGVRQLIVMPVHHAYYAAWHGDPLVAAQHSVVDLLALLALVAALWGVMRTLPKAYGSYMLAVLMVGLSEPVRYEPLMSLPRFAAVLFPVYIWGGARLAGRGRMRAMVLGASALLLVVFTVQFATWHWVA